MIVCANGYSTEGDDALADENNVKSTVPTKRTRSNKTESIDDFLLTREAVIRFVQVFIANAVDRQKRNADKNGRSNVLLLIVSHLVLLSTVNLPRHVVTNVGSSLLLPKYTGPCRVVHRQRKTHT